MPSGEIKKDLQLFQASIKQLSSSISSASSLWSDKKFAELSTAVSEVASQSRDVMVSGDRCCSSIDRFDKVAAERY